MQIKSAATGATEYRDLQIQSSISHLLFIKTGPAEIINEQITLTLKTTQGKSYTVLPLSKVRRPAVISQFGLGYNLIQQMGAGVVKSAFLVSLSDAGAIDLQNSDYLSLDLTTLDATATYQVFGIESAVKMRAFNEYNSQVISGSEGQNKSFAPDDDAKAIAITNNGSMASIRLSYANGNEVTYLPEELNAIMRQGNDISFAADLLIEGDTLNQTISGGGTELWYIPLSNCHKFEITTIGGTDLTLIQIIRKAF